ncbi:MAG: DUF5683 domain-containing protein [bacterium]
MRRHLRVSVIAVGLCCFLPWSGVAAQEAADDSLYTDPQPADSTAPSAESEVITYVPQQSLAEYLDVGDSMNTEAHLTQKPTTALLKSLVVPGWGQVGNGRYVKAAFFAGLEGLLVGAAFNFRSQANEAWDDYAAATDSTKQIALYDYYDDRKTKRNRYTWFAALTMFVSMFDAYVDAHLSGFPLRGENQAIELEIGPTETYSVGASVKLSF